MLDEVFLTKIRSLSLTDTDCPITVCSNFVMLHGIEDLSHYVAVKTFSLKPVSSGACRSSISRSSISRSSISGF